MKRGQAKRWLTEKLKFQRKLTIGALAAMAGMGLVAWAFELGIVVLILWFGFYCSWTMAVLIGGGFLGALQMLILRGLQKELGDEKHPVHISARVARRPPDIAETTARAA